MDLARPPRILLLWASVGSGHLRAAEAIELALREIAPDALVRSVDVLTLATRPFKRCYGQMYLDFIDRAPAVLGFFYNLMDKLRPPAPIHGWDRLRVSLEQMSLRHFICMLKAEPWDLVINTHFLPAEIIAALRRQGRIKLPHVLITTDYETHRLWVNQPCEHYFTATEEAARYLECFGVPAGATTATGIPVLPAFARAKDRAACLARQGLTGDRPIILQLSGGCGVGPFEEVYRAVLQVEPPLEIVVATGYNATLKSRLEEIPTHQHRTKILGYTNQVDELMAIADLIVTKPGGLTTAESLASGLPLVIVYPVPGQEERNSDFLLENGAAIKINHIPTLALKVNEVLRDPAWLTQLKANARRLGRPRAAFEIVQRSLSLIRSADGVGSQVMVS